MVCYLITEVDSVLPADPAAPSSTRCGFYRPASRRCRRHHQRCLEKPGYPARDRGGWTGNDVFYVKERFLFFTHWVAVQVQSPWILHEPFDLGNPGPPLASQSIQVPAKGLICPAK
jgi:hypothetical protein